jgi:hypothetical protein
LYKIWAVLSPSLYKPFMAHEQEESEVKEYHAASARPQK